MIDFIISQPARRPLHDDGPRRRRGRGDRAHARPCRCSPATRSAKRMKSVALEREKIRAARTRAPGARRKDLAAPVAEAIHAVRSSSSFNLSKWVGQDEARDKADAGRLSRPGALRHVPVLPHGDADRAVLRRGVLSVRRFSSLTSAGDRQDRHLPRRRLSRHACCRILFLKNRIQRASCRSSARFPTRSTCC